MEQRSGESAHRPDEILSPEQARQRLEAQLEAASDRHDTRVVKAKKGLIGRLFSAGNLVKTAAMGLMDLTGVVTVYSAADLIAAISGARDLIAAQHQVDRDPEERANLRLKGGLKLGAAAIPHLPASVLMPSINAAIDVDRENPNKKK